MKVKACPEGHTILDILDSQRRYWCFECREFYNHKLKKKQKSVQIKGLTGEKEDDYANQLHNREKK